MNIFGEFRKNFIEQLNKENAKRLQVITAAILIVVIFQVIAYGLSDNDMYDNELIRVKLIIIVLGVIIITGLQFLRKDLKFAVKHSYIIIFASAFIMIFSSILNTFYAQKITNDISIYLLVLMAVIAANRMDFKSTMAILLANYIIFAAGMHLFQTNPTYLFSHLFNGAISNVLAFIISEMFYKYSVKDYKDKLDIDQKNKKLKELSEKDDLTGLYNKRALCLRLAELLEEAKVTQGSVYLGILDLDHFKNINDRYGHLYGDEVLKLIAEKILLNVRDEDIVGRYGGDEFVVAFQDIDHEAVSTVMERILQEVNRLEFEECRLSFSCGIAVWNGESCEKLFERADAYMYDVKRFGKNDIKVERLKAVNQ